MTASRLARHQVLQLASGLDQQLDQGLATVGGGLDRLTMSKRAAAAYIGISVRTFERLVQARLIRHVRGLPTRYSRKAIEQYVDCHVHSVKARVA
jgi:uncharacterized protein YjhX (UPF0386 family)